MKNSTTDKVEGAAHELKGKIKEKVAPPSTIPNWKRKDGREYRGEDQKKVGDIKKVFEK